MLSSTSSIGFPLDPAADRVCGRARRGLAGRGQNMRVGYLANDQHHILPASWRHSPTGDTISRQGPGQQPEVITAELTTTIIRYITDNDWQRPLIPPDQAHHAISGYASRAR